MADPSLYSYFDDGKLTGINRTYVYDTLCCGANEFEKKAQFMCDKSIITGMEELPITFAGQNVHRILDNSYSTVQLY